MDRASATETVNPGSTLGQFSASTKYDKETSLHLPRFCLNANRQATRSPSKETC